MILSNVIRLLGNRKLSVFLFHKVPHAGSTNTLNDVTLADFNRVIDLVQSQFNVIPLDDAIRFSPSSFPQNSACLTFDDGYIEWVTGVIPELVQRGLHATLFITTGQLSDHEMWHERIANAIEVYSCDSLKLHDSGLPEILLRTKAERKAAILTIEGHLKYQSLQFRNEILLQLESIVGIVPHGTNPTLTAQHIREFHGMGFTIGAHTINHPILRICDPKTAFEEIGGAKEELEAVIRAPVTTFAYPNGQPHADFAEQHIRMVKKAGYECAVSTQPGAWSPNECRWQIPRFTPWGPDATKMKLQIIRNLASSPVYIDY